MKAPSNHSLFQILILSLLHIITKSQTCPASAPYYDADSAECFSICPWSGIKKYYKYDNSNPKTCVDICPGSYFGFDGNQSCTLNCPNSPTQTYKDTVNKKCVNECPANYFGYLGTDATNNQKCVQSNNI